MLGLRPDAVSSCFVLGNTKARTMMAGMIRFVEFAGMSGGEIVHDTLLVCRQARFEVIRRWKWLSWLSR
jgi:hypothetical protein